MYLEHFGLYTAPFSLVPHLRFLFMSHTFEETMAHLVYGLEGGEDVILITGEIGAGKTLALNYLQSNIKGHYQIVVVNTTQVNFRELMKLVLADLGIQPAPDADRADLISALSQYLAALVKSDKQLLLVIDEAQNLDVETMEGIRLLTNIGTPEEQWMQLILAGQPGLRTLVDHPDLAQLRQRVRVHYHLDALSEQETGEYIDHRLRVAGCERPLFPPEAVRLIHRRSGGIPRLVNVLADKALLAAYVDGAQQVDPAHVSEEELSRTSAEEQDHAKRAARSSESVTSGAPSSARGAAPASPAPLAPPAHRPAATATPRSGGGGRRVVAWVGAIVALAIAAFLVWGRLKGDSAARPEPVQTAVAAAEEMPAETAAAPSESIDQPSASDAEGAGPHAATDSLLSGPAMDAAGMERAQTADSGESTAEDGVVTELTGPCIQVASFRELDRALILRNRLARISDRTAVVKVNINNELWYRVYSGPWDSWEDATAMDLKIKNSGISGWTLLMRL